MIRHCKCYQSSSLYPVALPTTMGLCNAQRKRGCYVFTGVLIAVIASAMIGVGVSGLGEDDCSGVVPWWNIVGGVFIILGLAGRLTLTRVMNNITNVAKNNSTQPNWVALSIFPIQRTTKLPHQP